MICFIIRKLKEQNKRCFKITTRRKRPRRSSKVSKRTTVKKKVNKKGYTNKYGTRVGPYDRKVSSFPNSYIIYRMVNGERRLCKITRKNGKEYMHVLDNQRKAKPITYAEAKKHFEKLPEYRQEVDKRFRAKKTFEQTQITSSYLTKTGTSRYDVEGLDTPSGKVKSKRKGDFYQDFYKYDENQKERDKLKTEIAVLKHEINYTDAYMSYIFKNADISPKAKEKVKQYEDMKAKLKEKETELRKIDKIEWQKKPDKFYSSEIDPRYNRDLKEKRLEYTNVKASIKHCETEIESGRLVKGGRLEENFKKRLANNLKWKERLEKELDELRKEPKSIYWDDKLIEATIEEGKRLPTNVRRSMPEKYKKEYKSMIEKQNIEKLKSEKEAEKREKERIAKEKAKEKAIREAKKKIPEMQEKFSENAKGRYAKEIWKEQPLYEFGDGLQGISDPSRITLLTTNKQFEDSQFGEQFKDHKEVPFQTKEMIMDSYGFQYEFDEKGECTFSQEYVDIAMKSMENPKVYYKKNTPLIIKDDTYTYLIAPRVEETIDDDDWDEISPNVKEKKDEFDPTIRISQVKYKDLMKSKKKAEMVEEIRNLEVKKEGYSNFDAKRKDKHEVLHDLLTLRKEILNRPNIRNYSFTEPDGTYHVLAGSRKGMTEKEREDKMVKALEQYRKKWEGKNYDSEHYLKLTRNWDNLEHEVEELDFQKYDYDNKKWIREGEKTHVEKEVKELRKDQSKDLDEQESRVGLVMATIEDEMSTTKKATKRYKELSKAHQELQEERSEIKKEIEEERKIWREKNRGKFTFEDEIFSPVFRQWGTIVDETPNKVKVRFERGGRRYWEIDKGDIRLKEGYKIKKKAEA